MQGSGKQGGGGGGEAASDRICIRQRINAATIAVTNVTGDTKTLVHLRNSN